MPISETSSLVSRRLNIHFTRTIVRVARRRWFPDVRSFVQPLVPRHARISQWLLLVEEVTKIGDFWRCLRTKRPRPALLLWQDQTLNSCHAVGLFRALSTAVPLENCAYRPLGKSKILIDNFLPKRTWGVPWKRDSREVRTTPAFGRTSRDDGDGSRHPRARVLRRSLLEVRLYVVATWIQLRCRP
jgi:hypothetical protein